MNINKIQELLTRGVENIYPSKEFLEDQLLTRSGMHIYCGYDPTAPTLHIGHLITLLKLKQFQELGHIVTFLVGDFTARIGDPTDKNSARKSLTKEQVNENCNLYQEQASRIIDLDPNNIGHGILSYNSVWLNQLKPERLLEIFSNFTVPRLLERDMFQNRLKDGKTIGLHEFVYPALQAFDSVYIQVDGEVGGNDQTFNMLAGRDLVSKMRDKEKFVISMKLLTDNTGKKMGKTEGNMVAFTDTPEDMFGKIMSWSDEMILPGFELCTMVPMEKVLEMKKNLDAGMNPVGFKKRLAYEITSLILGENAGSIGLNAFGKLQDNQTPDQIAEKKFTGNDVLTVLVESGFTTSRTQARDVIDNGGVSVNGELIKDYIFILKPGDVLKKGRRSYIKVL